MSKLETLHELLGHELQDLYNAENQIIKALPKMARKAANGELRAAFEEHLEQTAMQAQRLERALSLLDLPIRGRHCAGMEGIIEEGKKLMEEDASDDVMDAGLIASAQKVEHYEIAAYGSVKAWAELLGQDEITALLEETLHEEESADRKLSEIAESVVNAEAAAGDTEDSEEESSMEEESGKSEETGSEGATSGSRRPSRQRRQRKGASMRQGGA